MSEFKEIISEHGDLTLTLPVIHEGFEMKLKARQEITITQSAMTEEEVYGKGYKDGVRDSDSVCRRIQKENDELIEVLKQAFAIIPSCRLVPRQEDKL